MGSDQVERYLKREPEFATGWQRLAAFLCDIAPIVGITLLIEPLRAGSAGVSQLIVLALIGVPYFLVFEWLTARTPGKLLLRMRVVSETGARPSFRSVAIRNLVRPPEIALACVFGTYDVLFLEAASRRQMPGWIAGIFRFFSSPYHQRWGDELAGTYVIKGQWYPVRHSIGIDTSSKKDASNTGIRLSGRARRRDD